MSLSWDIASIFVFYVAFGNVPLNLIPTLKLEFYDPYYLTKDDHISTIQKSSKQHHCRKCWVVMSF